ncbi:MAG TPA: M1 family aminopeptidase [Cyclobacteriaceae bacterium]|nr:M1 family peptidase [Cyclobacteriaceae bacterium]HMV10829.1 M1 family aminopeptidase [Cyclobacteriaceae bacterium]HMV90628.1 M1 family aminopeptidase [Cyclobacteriaceae bacterium]HMX02642.1 M1 family aminopeptidase [Cyclobacteriaceae bacterium]HMY92135.1 M1 family aminopeptidase [Cyclobacteriaceae bacterium]
MRKIATLAFVLALLTSFTGYTQTEQQAPLVYQPSAEKVHDLVHTKLEARFDYAKSQMLGKVWITLKPHFYTTDSLKLDAKGMDLRAVQLVSSTNVPLKYSYDGWVIKIKLDKPYTRNDKYTIYIDYTAKPNELKVKGSAAINDAKGLYFINPTGADKNKPTQIWTQGETEATSAWCPTIDKPNQKTTSEILMVVPDKYVTLSNGKLVSQTKNADGTRTDHWKMELPHAPYLFFMGVGDYAIVKDTYNGMEVNYYVEKEYASVAKKIFGNTPEMIAFFEKVTGVKYPWVKYSQMTARDYVSGAMENTTATLHQEGAQQDARELVDENSWEGTIAHELFHQWFGDYVTAESWSNLTVNESFADYSEYLWLEHKYGADDAGAENFTQMQSYLGQPEESEKDLVRFYYDDKEEMFDLVSYQKGGRILHMLRQVVGDSAFFKGLNKYLTDNKFGTGEAHQLRLALESVSGRDLNWFFNQWYFGYGHPVVDISYAYDDAAKKVSVTINQMQGEDNLFELPLDIDVYNGAQKVRYSVWLNEKSETFTFPYTTRPDLVNVDANKFTLWQKTDNKTLDNYIHQYKYAGSYLDRREAFIAALKQTDNPKAIELLKLAMTDKSARMRRGNLSRINPADKNLLAALEPSIVDLAKNDKAKLVRAQAISLLANLKKAEYTEIFKAGLNDSSYSVAGASLYGLSQLDKTLALAEAKKLAAKPNKGSLKDAIAKAYMLSGSEELFPSVYEDFKKMQWWEQLGQVNDFATYLSEIKSSDKVKKGVDLIITGSKGIPEQYHSQTNVMINKAIQIVIDKKASDKKLKAELEKKLLK